MASTQITTTRRAQSTPYSLRASPARTEKVQNLSSEARSGNRVKRKREHSDDGTWYDFPPEMVKKRIRRAYHRGKVSLPSPNRRLLSLPTPDRSKIYHDFTAGGIPPLELLSEDTIGIWRERYPPPETEWGFNPKTGRMEKHITMRALPKEDGTFGIADYGEQIQGWSLLLKRYCGSPVSPAHALEPQEMTWKEWEQFARPIGLLLEAVEGVGNVYDAITGK